MPETGENFGVNKSIFHPAFIINNIKNAIHLIHNQTDDHYASWVEYFHIHTCAYNVKDHSDTATPRWTDIDNFTWDLLDCLVKQWIYNAITPDLSHTIMKPSSYALDLWKHLQEIFQENRATRDVYLEEQFNNTHLVAFSNITYYCAWLKNLADQFENVGNPISETKMVLQLVVGLTKGEFDTVATLIQQTDLLRSFNKAQSQLLLEEFRRTKQESHVPQALVTQRTDQTSSDMTNSPHNNSDSNNHGQFRGNHHGGGRWSPGGQRGGKGHGRGNNRTQHKVPFWPGWFPFYPYIDTPTKPVSNNSSSIWNSGPRPNSRSSTYQQ